MAEYCTKWHRRCAFKSWRNYTSWNFLNREGREEWQTDMCWSREKRFLKKRRNSIRRNFEKKMIEKMFYQDLVIKEDY